MSHQPTDFTNAQKRHPEAVAEILKSSKKPSEAPDASWDWSYRVAVRISGGTPPRGRALLESGDAFVSLVAKSGRKSRTASLSNDHLLSLSDADLPMAALGQHPQPSQDLVYLWRPSDSDQPGWKPYAVLSSHQHDNQHWLSLVDDHGSETQVCMSATGQGSETISSAPKKASSAPLPTTTTGWPYLADITTTPISELLGALRGPGFMMIGAGASPTDADDRPTPGPQARVWGWSQTIPAKDRDVLESVDARSSSMNLLDVIAAINSGGAARLKDAIILYACGASADDAISPPSPSPKKRTP